MFRSGFFGAICALLISAWPEPAPAAELTGVGESRAPGFVETNFPFFSSVLDARNSGVFSNNLTPRGIVLNLGNDCWACFDTDLLRISAIWTGQGVSAISMAQGSYRDQGFK